MRRARLALLALSLVCSCATPSILKPKTGPGSDYPCGLNGHSCGNSMCCDNGSDCGGPVPSCPAGLCCWHGDSSSDFAAHPPVKQRPE